ncbi:MAG TPA: ATP-binding cassette domain-containing protein, partial [Patescibacteria group bacterium]|nr:ATP-binding cassette domain-containing protein [Patescibacteria group bacterium]
MESLIKVSNINKSFDVDRHHLPVLKDIDFNVKRGEFFMLLGPSGSGKSTLLRIMAGLIEPTTGEITTAPNTKTSFIFQNFALFPWLSVIDNIEYGLKMQGMAEHERRRIAEAEIEQIGLKGFEHHFPRELSGGMKQRVGIARALVMSPDVVFLDEPFSALDSFTARKLRTDLLKVWE